MEKQNLIDGINRQLKKGIELAIKKEFDGSRNNLEDVLQKSLKLKVYDSYTLAAAHLGGLYYVTGKIEEGIQIMEDTIEKYETILPNYDFGLITCKQNVLIIDVQRHGDFAKGIPIINQYYRDLLLNAASLRTEIEKGRLKLLLGTCYLHAHEPYKSLKTVSEALEILENIEFEDIEVAELLSNAHYQKGTVYYKIGDYFECLKYLHKAEYINNTQLKVDNINSTTLYSVIGSVYFKIKNLHLAEIYYEKTIKLIDSIGYTGVGFGYVYVGLGYINYLKNDKEKALKLINYVINEYKGKFEKHPDNGYAIDMLATVFKLDANAEKCIRYRKKALALYDNNVTSLLKVIVTSIKLINDYIDFDQLTNAKQWIDKIETLLNKNFDGIKQYTEKTSVNFQYYFYWLSFYVAKCNWQYAKYIHSKNIEDLKTTYSFLTKGMSFYELVRKYIKNIQSLYSIANETQQLFNVAINTGYKLYNYTLDENFLQECFKFSEWNKGFQLLLKLTHKDANEQLPTELAQKEEELNFSIDRLESLISKEIRKEAADTVKIQTLQNENERLHNERDALIDKIAKLNPNYFNWKHQTQTVAISDLQKVLQLDELLIEYFCTAKYIYIFVIGKGKTELIQQAIQQNLKNQVQQFNQILQGSLIFKIAEAGKALYDVLIKPIEHLTQNVTALKIIPDNHLAQLPFESLISEVPNHLVPNQLPYLICRHQVSYHYSASLYYFGKLRADKKTSYPKQFGGFAPVYKTKQIDGQVKLHKELALRVSKANGELNELVYSEEEIKQVAGLFDENLVDVFLHEKATTNNFLQNISNYKYVLIAAHHVYNALLPENSGILFAPSDSTNNNNHIDQKDWSYLNNHTFEEAIKAQQMLFEADAYGLNVKADLVVLSCCETGLGKVITGEGIMGINRGFLFAGAKNIIYTLFKVYDKQSSQFSFYLFDFIINHQQTFDVAIRNAKLKMIDDELSLPKDWAGYVLMGC